MVGRMIDMEFAPSESDKRIFSIAAIILWEIWETRCKYISEGAELDARRVTGEVRRITANGFLRCMDMMDEMGMGWKSPPQLWLKVNVDVATWKENTATALVVKDWNSDHVLSASNICPPSFMIMAAARAILQALMLANRMEWDRVTVESNSLMLIQQLSPVQILPTWEWEICGIIAEC